MEEETLEEISHKPLTRKPIIFGVVSLILLLCMVLVVGLTANKRVKAPTPKAYFSTAKAWFLPYTASPMQVGDAFPVYLVADFGTLDVVGFTIKITYSPDKLELVNGAADIIVNSGFSSEIKKEVRAGAGEIYLSFVNINGVTGVLGLANPWVKFNFTVKDLGAAAIYLDKTYPSHQLVGITGGTDSSIDLRNETDGNLISISYDLGSSTLTPTPTRMPITPPVDTTTPVPCTCPSGVPPKSKGNANCDEVIDLRDFQLWRNERWGRTSTKNADFNCDTFVDIRDFQLWLNGKWGR